MLKAVRRKLSKMLGAEQQPHRPGELSPHWGRGWQSGISLLSFYTQSHHFKRSHSMLPQLCSFKATCLPAH